MTLICCGDATPDVHAPGVPWTARPAMSDAIPVTAIPAGGTIPPARSRFEAMVPLAAEVPSKSWDLLGVLFAATLPVRGGGCQVLRPLWVEEAMHRAFCFLRLVHALSRRGERSAGTPLAAGTAYAIACDLAAQFRELQDRGEREMWPSTAVLRDVVTGLGALFGGPANVTLRTRTEDVSLPGYKRRALVLVAAELVSNALLHAFVGRQAGQIDVDLTVAGPNSVCLRVADNGIGFTDLSPNLACGVASGLASLLEVDLANDRLDGWTIAEIVLPVSVF